MKIENYKEPGLDNRLILIALIIVLFTFIAILVQTYTKFVPDYETLRAEQNTLQIDIDRLGWEIADLREDLDAK